MRPSGSSTAKRSDCPAPLLAILVLSLLSLTACSSDATPTGLAGMVRNPLANVAAVSLPDVSNDGELYAMVAPDDGLLIAYFGYTSCPDVCPTTMSDLKRAVDELGGDANRIQVAFVTIDPARDMPEIATTYVQRFFGDAVALRTDDPNELAAAAQAFGAGYEVVVDAEGGVEVSHTSFLYAIDSTGTIQVQWPFGMTSEDMNNDIRYLLEKRT